MASFFVEMEWKTVRRVDDGHGALKLEMRIGKRNGKDGCGGIGMEKIFYVQQQQPPRRSSGKCTGMGGGGADQARYFMSAENQNQIQIQTDTLQVGFTFMFAQCHLIILLFK